jgi:putative ABC transport system permease protein
MIGIRHSGILYRNSSVPVALIAHHSSLLSGISPYDVLTYLGVTVVAGATTVIATYLPVRRAVRVNPIIALRHE